jgi:hypothetical protein
MIFWEGYKVLDLIFVPEFEIYLVLFFFSFSPNTLEIERNHFMIRI